MKSKKDQAAPKNGVLSKLFQTTTAVGQDAKTAVTSAEKKVVVQPQPKPLPESIVALHKEKGPDELSNAEYFGDQSWTNLTRIQRRLEREGLDGEKLEKEMLNLYSQLIVLEDESGGVVPCFYHGTKFMHTVGTGDGEKELPSLVTPRKMAYVNEEGKFVYFYTDAETGRRKETTDPEVGQRLKMSGSWLTKLDRDRQTQRLIGTGRVIFACPHCKWKLMRKLDSPGLAHEDAQARLKSLLADMNKRNARSEAERMADEAAGIAKPRGGDQMRQGFQRAEKRTGGRPYRK